jgi:hypothetical protein
LKRSHDKNVDEMERLFGYFIEGVAFDEEHIFVGEVHMKKEE